MVRSVMVMYTRAVGCGSEAASPGLTPGSPTTLGGL